MTYNCNVACNWCIQHLDVIDWKHLDTNITLEEIRVCISFLKKCNVKKLRVTGGEPLTHPELTEIREELDRYWKQHRTAGAACLRIYTNGTLDLPLGIPGRYSVVRPDDERKSGLYDPCNVSPADLGIEPQYGFDRPCGQQLYCGRWFDCFGFASCGVEGILGNMLGEDCYQPSPVMLGRSSVCQHCLFSLSKQMRLTITKKVHEKKIPDITKTFKRAIERWKDDPPKPKRFFERLPKDCLPGEKANERSESVGSC